MESMNRKVNVIADKLTLINMTSGDTRISRNDENTNIYFPIYCVRIVLVLMIVILMK